MTNKTTPKVIVTKDPEVVVPIDSKPYIDEPIVISGPPGVGKSAIGKKLAENMAIPFYDLDDLVANKLGLKTTKEVIENKGRSFFWETQHLCLEETFQEKSGMYILTLGGGVVIRLDDNLDFTEENKELIRKHAFNICLTPSHDIDESVEILLPRQNNEKRVTGVQDSNQLKSYLNERIPQYISESDRIIYTHNAPIEKIVDVLLKLLNKSSKVPPL